MKFAQAAPPPRDVTTHLRSGELQHGTAGTVRLLLELGLVGLEHTDLAPAVEEESDGRSPQHQHNEHDEGLLSSHQGHTRPLCRRRCVRGIVTCTNTHEI